MRTVMKEYKKAHHEETCEYGQEEDYPVRMSFLHGSEHYIPQGEVRNDRVYDLPRCFAKSWVFELGHILEPISA